MARAVSELSEALAKKGHEVHIFTQRGENQSDYNRIDGVNYHRCSFDPTGDILWHCEKMCNAMVERFYATERIEGKFDVIHVHDWHTINAANHLKLRSSYPFVITFHSTEWGGTYASDRIITVSQTMKKELMWLYKTPDQKIDVIPNGIFSKRYEMNIDPGGIKERYGIHPLAPVILFIGRLAQQKGPDILMGAIPGVLIDVSKAIRILGYVPQKEYLELLNACDVVCIPSRNEPFGLVLLEAWSAKKAVVASDVGGLSENIENFKNGIKVHPTSDSLSWGINYIINDPYGVRKLGEEGYESVQKKFRWNVIAGQTVDCYKKVL
jgi:glycosyltransferase involved in cell wall biosynthesis